MCRLPQKTKGDIGFSGTGVIGSHVPNDKGTEIEVQVICMSSMLS